MDTTAAAQGIRFTDAYAASSVCSPTRSSIMSGKYPARNDLTIWLGGHSAANAKLLDAPDVRLTRSGDAYLVASNATGVALVKPDEPLGPTATFPVRLTPRARFPANGFLTFGDTPNDEELVKCGLFVGGNYAAIYEGAYPSDDVAKLTMPLRSQAAYDLTVGVDLAGGTVEMSVGDDRVTKKLSRTIDEIRYYGYAVITTESEFSAIEAAPFSPR